MGDNGRGSTKARALTRIRILGSLEERTSQRLLGVLVEAAAAGPIDKLKPASLKVGFLD